MTKDVLKTWPTIFQTKIELIWRYLKHMVQIIGLLLFGFDIAIKLSELIFSKGSVFSYQITD